jgi:hypothetical protein
MTRIAIEFSGPGERFCPVFPDPDGNASRAFCASGNQIKAFNEFSNSFLVQVYFLGCG